MNSALELAPEDSRVHLVQGLMQVANHRPNQAIPHFLEALRIEPELESAREGLIEALKARSWLFRWPWLFMTNVAKGRGWAHCLLTVLIMITFIMTRQLVQAPEVQLKGAFVFIAAAFALMSSVWFADPLMHSCLLLHPVGRHAMSRRQVQAAIRVSVVTFTTFFAFGAWGLGVPLGRDAALVLVALIAPVSTTRSSSASWRSPSPRA